MSVCLQTDVGSRFASCNDRCRIHARLPRRPIGTTRNDIHSHLLSGGIQPFNTFSIVYFFASWSVN